MRFAAMRKFRISVNWLYNCLVVVASFEFAECSERCRTPAFCSNGGQSMQWIDIPSCAGISSQKYDQDIKNLTEKVENLQAEYQSYEKRVNALLVRSNVPVYIATKMPNATSELKRCLIPVTCTKESRRIPGWMNLEGDDLVGSKYTTKYKRLTAQLTNLKMNYEELIKRHAPDKDECANVSVCSHINGSSCENTIGSYNCKCDKGYEMNSDKASCIDFDECQANTYDCHSNATCSNTVGSYNCTCDKNFYGNGINCSDCLQTKFHFPARRTSDWILITTPIPTVDEFSACAWVTPLSSTLVGVLASYATTESNNAFLLEFADDMLYVCLGPCKNFTLKVESRTHVCVTASPGQRWAKAYISGHYHTTLYYSDDQSHFLGGGTFLLGQDQDSIGGHFAPSQSYGGTIENFMLWYRILSDIEIKVLYRDGCSCPKNRTISMASDEIDPKGNVASQDVDQCYTV